MVVQVIKELREIFCLLMLHTAALCIQEQESYVIGKARGKGSPDLPELRLGSVKSVTTFPQPRLLIGSCLIIFNCHIHR